MKTFNPIQKFFGNQIRELRKIKGFSQEDFALECKLDRTYVSQVELGRRNLCLQNIQVMADVLNVSIATLFSPLDILSSTETLPVNYRINPSFSVNCGFRVSSPHVLMAANTTIKQLQHLPFSLYQHIDLKTLSAIVGAIFVNDLATEVGAIVNPIEKGHPDIIPIEGRNASESQLRNYPNGLEIKVTVGTVLKGSKLLPGMSRIDQLTGITWQAHHREVNHLLGLVIDFAGTVHDNQCYPIITGAFYADNLSVEDWGEISGTTGRNTKVTGMNAAGREKMGQGWILLLDQDKYLKKYSDKLKFILGK